MKALALFKKEVMSFEIHAYVIWIICLMTGCLAFLNPPNFIINMGDIFSFMRKTFELVWGLGIAFVMGVVAVIASKFGTQLWEDRLKPMYEKRFKKKKNDPGC